MALLHNRSSDLQSNWLRLPTLLQPHNAPFHAGLGQCNARLPPGCDTSGGALCWVMGSWLGTALRLVRCPRWEHWSGQGIPASPGIKPLRGWFACSLELGVR